MTGRTLPPGRYRLGDLAAGDRIDAGSITVPAALIDAFADLSGDRFAIHMDDGAARDLGFPARVAHGLLVLSLIDGLKNRAPAQIEAVASLGWDMAFRAPVLAGDTIGAEFRVASLRPASAPRQERGIVTLAVTVTNQDGHTVQEGTTRLMVLA